MLKTNAKKRGKKKQERKNNRNVLAMEEEKYKFAHEYVKKTDAINLIKDQARSVRLGSGARKIRAS